MLGVTFWPFLNFNSHWNGQFVDTCNLSYGWSVFATIKKRQAQRISLAYEVYIPKKNCAIATPTQEVWLADDVIPPWPVFGWWAACHWIQSLKPYRDYRCQRYWLPLTKKTWRGKWWLTRKTTTLVSPSFMCMMPYVGSRASPKSRTQYALAEANTVPWPQS